MAIPDAGAGDSVAVVIVVSSSSKQPNQPGVLQVDVEVFFVLVFVFVVVDALLVVLSSKQPNHPGVLHVSVLVLADVDDDVDVGTVKDVVVSVPLLSKNSQGKQSVQLTYCSHLAG